MSGLALKGPLKRLGGRKVAPRRQGLRNVLRARAMRSGIFLSREIVELGNGAEADQLSRGRLPPSCCK
jgi:hypothetical protein